MNLLAFERALKSASSLRSLNQALEQYLATFGITAFAFTYYSYYPNSLNKLKYDHASSIYTAWHRHFTSEGYDDVDSTLDEVYQASLPIFWNLANQLKNAKGPREKKMRQDSIEYGIEQGLSIPIHGPQEDFAILVLIQMRGQTCLESWQTQQHQLFTAAYYYYYYLQRQLLKTQASQEKQKLSKRDIQCLILIAKQYSTEAIAKELHITERTVNYHIQRLNKKLGTQNKYLSVIKALKEGLIRF